MYKETHTVEIKNWDGKISAAFAVAGAVIVVIGAIIFGRCLFPMITPNSTMLSDLGIVLGFIAILGVGFSLTYGLHGCIYNNSMPLRILNIPLSRMIRIVEYDTDKFVLYFKRFGIWWHSGLSGANNAELKVQYKESFAKKKQKPMKKIVYQSRI